MPKVKYTAAKGLFQEAGSGIDLASDTSGVQFRQKTEVLSSVGTFAAPTKTLTAADSGTTFFCDISTVSIVAQLPVPEAGLYYKFILNVASHNEGSKDLVIVTNSAAVDINGHVLVNGAHVEVTNATSNIRIDSSAGDATIGDFFEFHCDGTDWYVHGSVDSASAVVIDNAINSPAVP